ncbi:hypothetical protein pdam_00024697, partial [Pocillopora damicornis]
MPDTEAKLDAVLAKMDELLAAKDKQESKLNAILMKLESLEKSQKKTAQDVYELKDSYKLLDHDVTEHMGLDNIEVMRAHRTKINQAAASATAPQSRPIHVYLLRYPDKGRILKAAANTLKDNPFCDRQIFISDDVSKSVRKYPTCPAICCQNGQTRWWPADLLVADGNVEDLETFLLSVQDCICRIAQCTALGN